MSKLQTAYELGKRQALQEHMEKEAFVGLLRGAGSLIARGARAGYSAASPHVSKGVATARNSGSFRNIARQSKYIAKDTFKSPMTYAYGGFSAYTTDGSTGDKIKAGLTGGILGGATYKLMGGAHRAAFSRLARKGNNKALMQDLMNRGLSKKDAYAATMGRTRMLNSARSGDLLKFDQQKLKYKDALKGLKFKDRMAVKLKYDKSQLATGAAAFGVSTVAAEKAIGAMSNMAGVGEQQQNRMYENMSSNYPPPSPMRSGTIAGNNNPYSR